MSTTLEQLDRPLRVFLSYAGEDRAYAERLRRILSSSASSRIFSDDMLPIGDSWREHLVQELRGADVFMLIGTPRSSVSDFVLQELGAAWAIGKPIIVVTVEEGTTWRSPVESRMIQQVSLPELERPGVVERLFARLSQPRSEGDG